MPLWLCMRRVPGTGSTGYVADGGNAIVSPGKLQAQPQRVLPCTATARVLRPPSADWLADGRRVIAQAHAARQPWGGRSARRMRPSPARHGGTGAANPRAANAEPAHPHLTYPRVLLHTSPHLTCFISHHPVSQPALTPTRCGSVF